MRYIKLTFQYLKRNFLYVFALALVPAIIVGATTEPASLMRFFTEFLDGGFETFGQIFRYNSELTWKSALLALLVIPIILIFISALCGYESKHMRLGILKFDHFFRRVNNNILSVLKLAIAFLLILQLYALLCTTFAFLWVKAFVSQTVSLVFIIVTDVLLMIVVLFFMSLMLPWLPTMAITGLSMRKAMAETIISAKGHIFQLYLAVSLPLIPIYTIICLLAGYNVKYRFFVYIVLYLLMFSYYITLMYTSYCDINDVDREDLKNNYTIEDKGE